MTPRWLSLIYALAALSFAFLCVAAGIRAWQVGGEAKKTIKHADELVVTANRTATEAKPKVLDTLDSVKGAADEGKEAMKNTKAATKSLQVAADQSQIFYSEQLAYFRSGSVQRTVAEALVGVRNFSALALNANLTARDFRLKTQPKIDEIIDQANMTVVKANELFARPSIPKLIDDGQRLTGNLADTVELTNKRLPVLFDHGEKLTLHAGGIAESIDIIGKGIVAPKSKKRKVLDFFAESLIKSSPALLRR